MKILILSDFDEEVGGAEIYRSFLVDQLRERGHNVKIFSREAERTKLKKFFCFRDYVDLISVLRNFQPDLVFAHSIGSNISPLLLRLPCKKNIPVVFKLANIGICEKDSFFSGKFLFVRFFWSRIIHRAFRNYNDFYLAQSDFISEWLEDNLLVEQKNKEIIRNPSLFNIYDSESVNSNKILFVGRLSDEKGLYTLIKAFNRLNKTETKLEIIGPGNISKFEKMVKPNLKSNVIFRGRMPHKDLKRKYREAKIFVTPSTVKETFGLTILESMSQATPVITTDIGAQKELVNEAENGFLIPPNNVDQLEERLGYCLNNSEIIEKMSKSALETAQEYSKSRHISRVEDLFRKVTKK